MNLITFPKPQPQPRPKRKAAIHRDGAIKYFGEPQIKLLRRTARDRASLALTRGTSTAIREWMLIDVLTSSGLRAAEAADLRVGDIRASNGESAIYVRNGKGGKSRVVQVPDSLRVHLKTYLAWKLSIGEAVGPDDYLFVGQRGAWSAWAVGAIVKRHLRRLGIYQKGKSAHSLRHSYATELYRQQRDLRAVQKQLGHASIQTTQIYADVTDADIQQQVRGLWGTI
jgi:site-specific recombinase XerD